MQLKHKYFLQSLGLTALWTILIFVIYYPSDGKLGDSFGVSVMMFFTRYVALFISTFLLILRLLKVLKNPYFFFYILFAVLNLCVGILGIVLYALGEAILWWLNASLLNLLVGFLCIADSFWLASEESGSH